MNLFILEDESRQAAGLKQYLKDYQEQKVIEESVIVKAKNGVAFRVLPSDIVYVEAENRRIHIYTVLTEHIRQYMSIKTFWQLFPQLVQIHKKYLVNPSYIKHYDKTTQMLKIGEYELPVGRKYRNFM